MKSKGDIVIHNSREEKPYFIWNPLFQHESLMILRRETLLSLKALLSAPKPNDPQDVVMVEQYLKDNEEFVSIAHYWTQTFSKGAHLGIMEHKVQCVVDMGIPVDSESHIKKSWWWQTHGIGETI